MIVYQTDNTGLYVGAIHLNNSDICPISGEFLIPGRCVKIKPPETPKDKVAYWKGSEWILEDVPKEPEPKPPEPTPEQIQQMFINAVQMHMDSKVKERKYDNILSACSYANSIDPIFQSEAIACVAWRDNVWRSCYNILNEVETGLREIPTVEELIAELPELVWPE